MPLYEWILKQAIKYNMSGATAVRGIEGFGSKQQMHSNKIMRLSQNLPVIVELVDVSDKVESFLETIEAEIKDLHATLEDVEILTATLGDEE